MNYVNTPWGVQEGDRIRLVAPMKDDPRPIPVREEGIVTRIFYFGKLGRTVGVEWLIGVDWKNGRSLPLAIPLDKFEIVHADTCKFCKEDVWPTGRDESGAEWMNVEGEVVCWAAPTETDAGSNSHDPMTIDDEVNQTLDLMRSIAGRTRKNPPDLAGALEEQRTGGVIVVDTFEEAGAAIASILRNVGGVPE